MYAVSTIPPTPQTLHLTITLFRKANWRCLGTFIRKNVTPDIEDFRAHTYCHTDFSCRYPKLRQVRTEVTVGVSDRQFLHRTEVTVGVSDRQLLHRTEVTVGVSDSSRTEQKSLLVCLTDSSRTAQKSLLVCLTDSSCTEPE